jgi:hypothetical protein
MSDTSIHFKDGAPKYLRDLISHKAQEYGDGEPGHIFLKPGAPRWMTDEIRAIQRDAEQIHRRTVEDHLEKPATWLMQIDGYIERCGALDGSGSRPDYCSSAAYQLACACWDARLYVAPSTTREQAITLTAGFLKWLVEMCDEDFNRYKMPQNNPRLSPPNRV